MMNEDEQAATFQGEQAVENRQSLIEKSQNNEGEAANQMAQEDGGNELTMKENTAP